MEVGAEVWIKDSLGDEAWIAGNIVSKVCTDDGLIKFTALSDYNEQFSISVHNERPESDQIKLRNDEADADVDNLINLTHLHEPALLYCLQYRYIRSKIYTYTGPILIALNPFKKLDLYKDSILGEYYNAGLLKAQGIELGKSLAPHVYAIADAAYRDMMGVVLHGYHTSDRTNRGSGLTGTGNQSILISGESGAGKTESTKIVLRYLTTVGNGDNSNESNNEVMDKVLQSNPILEAFGNARTLRNDNSSRFGKFIELNFSKRGILIGGSIRTYLLEKVRLPFQQYGERNFHIFYQIAAGASAEDRTRWQLKSIEDYEYSSRGEIFKLQHVDDEQEYRELRKALNILNFTENDQQLLFDIIVAILNLGQLKFSSIFGAEGEGSEIVDDSDVNDSLENACRLLGLEKNNLLTTLCSRIIVARDETYVKQLTAAQSADARDALAKAIYGKVFQWIVATINRSIRVDQSQIRANIGVLDIFGFESFKNNSFEQLCINYTNETLQQQFNQYIFKMEQQEYQKEKIEWSFIEFPDNKDCLDLIEHKVNGLLAMLDDECKLPKSSDEKFAGRIYKAFEGHSRFSTTAALKRDYKFCVHHYAGSVEYSTITFVEKNKDELPREAYSLLQSSSNSLIISLFSPNEVDPTASKFDKVSYGASPSSKASNKNTKNGSAINTLSSVGSQFKEQLNSLMDSVYATAPHYIRCLKPNDHNRPDDFSRLRITEQLRYGGVLEAVRVARSGFPVRLIHAEFYSRYRSILPPKSSTLPRFVKADSTQKWKELCCLYLEQLWELLEMTKQDKLGNTLPDRKLSKFIKAYRNLPLQIDHQSIQLGISKIFLRKQSHDLLEALRFKRVISAAVTLQSQSRCFLTKSKFYNMKIAVLMIQRVFRGHKHRALAHSIRMQRSASRIQSVWRRYISLMRFHRFYKAVLSIQYMFRSKLKNRSRSIIRQQTSSLKISRFIVGSVVKMKWLRYKRSLIFLQNKYRCKQAKIVLKARRAEAKDLGKLKQSNDLLKEEIEKLKAKAYDDKEKVKKEMELKAQFELNKLKNEEIELLKQQVINLGTQLHAEVNSKQNAVKKLEEIENVSVSPSTCENCGELSKQLEAERHHYEQLLNSAKHKIEFLEDQLQQSKEQLAVLQQENIHLLNQKTIKHESIKVTTDSNKPSATDGSSKQYQDLLERFEKEQYAKSILEHEISRLRKLSLEQQMQVDTLKTQRAAPVKTLRPTNSFKKNQPNVVSGAEDANAIVKSQSNWSSTWDEEDDNSEESGKAEISSVTSSAIASNTVKTFERNLEIWRAELRQGFKAKFWDGQRHADLEVQVRLDSTGKILQFICNQSRRAFTLFSGKIELNPLSFPEISECLPGAELQANLPDSNQLLTLISKSLTNQTGGRIVVLRLSSKEERDALLNKLRALMASEQMSEGKKLPANSSRMAPKKGQQFIEATPQHFESSERNETVMHSNPLMTQRQTRRLSVREAVLEENLAQINQSTHKDQNESIRKKDHELMVNVKDLMQQLKEERDQQERMKLQLMMMNNELAEKDDQLSKFKKEAANFEKLLVEKDNMYKQDNMVRLQLGKRLEQVLMDKEEALEQLELLKVQLETIRTSIK